MIVGTTHEDVSMFLSFGRQGQWHELRHVANGDVVRFAVDRVGADGSYRLVFDDDAHLFDIDHHRRFPADGRASQARPDATTDTGPPEQST